MKTLGLAAVAIVLSSGALAQEPATPETVTIEAQRQREGTGRCARRSSV